MPCPCKKIYDYDYDLLHFNLPSFFSSFFSSNSTDWEFLIAAPPTSLRKLVRELDGAGGGQNISRDTYSSDLGGVGAGATRPMSGASSTEYLGGTRARTVSTTNRSGRAGGRSLILRFRIPASVQSAQQSAIYMLIYHIVVLTGIMPEQIQYYRILAS